MKLQKGCKPASQYLTRALHPRPLTLYSPRHASSRSKPWLESDLVLAFKKVVKGRPKDCSWLHKYGQLARSMGVTYADALAVVRPTSEAPGQHTPYLD